MSEVTIAQLRNALERMINRPTITDHNILQDAIGELEVVRSEIAVQKENIAALVARVEELEAEIQGGIFSVMRSLWGPRTND